MVASDKEEPVTVTIDVSGENIHITPPSPISVGVAPKGIVHAGSAKRERAGKWSYHYTWKYSHGLPNQKHDNSYVYRLPFQSSKSFKLIQGYHGTFSHNIMGGYALDFEMPEGTAVVAAREGKVLEILDNIITKKAFLDENDQGNFVLILHNDGTLGYYIHLKPHGIIVRAGQTVTRGQMIAESGDTGYSVRPHLHFEVYTRENAKSRVTIPIQIKTSNGLQKEFQVNTLFTAVD